MKEKLPIILKEYFRKIPPTSYKLTIYKCELPFNKDELFNLLLLQHFTVESENRFVRISTYFYVPCPFSACVFISLHNVLSFQTLSNVCFLSILPSPCSTIQLNNFVRHVTYCFPRYHLPSVWFVCLKFTKPYFFITCSINFSSLFLIQNTTLFLHTFSLNLAR